MSQLTVVVPTYCEAANLPDLVAQIHAATTTAGIETEILVVDDNSPDDTISVCEELATRFPLRLITRTHERGLSSAVVAGMREATGDVLMCMDADLSHPPTAVPELYRAVAAGSDDQQPDCDFVVGSRYVPGGKTDDDWGALRLLNSLIATWLARPLSDVRDPMAGFFALRRETFEQAVELDPVGWKIGLELIVKCGCRHVRELPIHFRDRQHGESKLNLREQWNYLRHLRRLYVFRFPVLSRLAIGGAAVGIATGACLLATRIW